MSQNQQNITNNIKENRRNKKSVPPSCFYRQNFDQIKDINDLDIGFYLGLDQSFGKGTPRFTIGCRYESPGNKDESWPEPCTYSPPAAPKSTKIPHLITGSHVTPRANMTTDIDYINYRMFPRKISTSFGVRGCFRDHFHTVNDTPTCSFMMSSAFDPKQITIRERLPEPKPNEFPSPVTYTPRYFNVFPKSPSYYLSGPKFRDDWLYIQDNDIPAPDSYYPIKSMPSHQGYTFGDRSRLKNSKKFKPKTPYPIGTFIVDIQDVPIKEANDYIKKHPVLKTIVLYCVDRCLVSKPKNIRKCFLHLFKEYKKQRSTTNANKHSKSKISI